MLNSRIGSVPPLVGIIILMIDDASNDPGGSACTRISGMHKDEVIGNILARLSWTDSDPRVRLRLIT